MISSKLYSSDYSRVQRVDIPPTYTKKVMELLKPEQQDRVLEIGSGNGEMMRFLKQYCNHVLGTELNKETVKKVKGLIFSDATNIPLEDGSVNKTLSSHVLEHIIDLEKVFKELDRITTEGGLSLQIFPCPWITRAEGAYGDAIRITKNPIKAFSLARKFHIHRLTPSKLRKYLSGTKFEIVSTEKVYVPQEYGRSWVVLLKKSQRK
jgi:ubiquinone/menaquinone biosynthesis C-methylase UbiE